MTSSSTTVQHYPAADHATIFNMDSVETALGIRLEQLEAVLETISLYADGVISKESFVTSTFMALDLVTKARALERAMPSIGAPASLHSS